MPASIKRKTRVRILEGRVRFLFLQYAFARKYTMDRPIAGSTKNNRKTRATTDVSLRPDVSPVLSAVLLKNNAPKGINLRYFG